ncbi:hypothetical protein [Streptomyces sp. 2A115]|uniref:hypothetical protein n=1 Tax=Streptomyces sp. 2A115 TaxID=3457439 RepID=UPI003FD4D5C7
MNLTPPTVVMFGVSADIQYLNSANALVSLVGDSSSGLVMKGRLVSADWIAPETI